MGRTDVRQHVEPLEEVDCFKYAESQVAADIGCERDVIHKMNSGLGRSGTEECTEQ